MKQFEINGTTWTVCSGKSYLKINPRFFKVASTIKNFFKASFSKNMWITVKHRLHNSPQRCLSNLFVRIVIVSNSYSNKHHYSKFSSDGSTSIKRRKKCSKKFAYCLSVVILRNNFLLTNKRRQKKLVKYNIISNCALL